MAKKLQNIYEYLNNFTEKEINQIINELSESDKNLIKARYGEDLHNPTTSETFGSKESRRFYTHLVPKMKLLLAEKRIKTIDAKNKREKELKEQVLDLIYKNKTNKEMMDLLNINGRELYEIILDLKNDGTKIANKYYSDGSIKYKAARQFSEVKKDYFVANTNIIITEPEETRVKFLLISDLHFGNKLERIDATNRAFDYCAKNGINLILCGGDMIDGAYTKGEQDITEIKKQIEYFIMNYPHDKNILTFGVGGDHDLSAFYSNGLNLIDACNNYRNDVIIGGYNNTTLLIKNDSIYLYHHIDSIDTKKAYSPIILHGHSHQYKSRIEDKVLNITIPALSEVNQPMPTAVECEALFYKGYIYKVILKQVYFGNQDIVLNESEIDLSPYRTLNNDPLRYIETYRKNNYVLTKEKTKE